MTSASASRLLDALDRVLNSNSFLLEEPDSDDPDSARVLEAFLRSPRFLRLLGEADAARGWHNYATETDAGVSHLSGNLLVPDAQLDVRQIDEAALREELVSLLTTSRSPHHKQLHADEAQRLVDAFVRDLTHAGQNVRYFQVAPTFLNSSGYAALDPEHSSSKEPTYFDGGPFDRCVLMRDDQKFRLLLTNGAP
jgi:hypothetical protein